MICAMNRRSRVVSIMEAESVTGPAKKLIEFAQRARETDKGLPVVELFVAASRRRWAGDHANQADCGGAAAAHRSDPDVKSHFFSGRAAFDRTGRG
jgi:hypothetical protein